MLNEFRNMPDVDLDTSLTGFLRLQAASKGFKHTEDIGVHYGRPLIEALPDLAENLGVDLETLETIAPRSRSDDPARDYTFDRAHCDPFCPLCISEGRPWRKEWRHTLVTACSIHGVRLRDDCALCSEPLSPHEGGLAHCKCGLPLEQNPSEEASLFEMEIAKAMAGQPVDLCGFEQDHVADPELGSVLFFLGSHAHFNRTEKFGKVQKPKRISEAVEFMKPVESLLGDWPNGIRSEVHKRWQSGPDEGQTSAQRMGAWYRGLFGYSGCLARAIQSEVTRTVQTEIGDPYLSQSDEGSGFVSAAEAARKLGIRAERIVEAVRQGVVTGKLHRSPQGHRHTLVSTADIEAAKTNRQRFISRKQLNELLGVSKKQSYLLTEAGVMPEVKGSERPPLVDGTFDRDTIERLVGRIRDRSRQSSKASESAVALRDINLHRTTDKSALLELYRAIFGGELTAINFPDGGALSSVEFDGAQVDKFLKSFGRPAEMTASDVAKAAGWKPECVTHWCKLGLLKAELGKSKNLDAWLIRQEDLIEFQKGYIVLSDLAAASGTTSRSLLRKLGNHGIETVGAKTVGSTSRGHLLRTRSVSAILGRCL